MIPAKMKMEVCLSIFMLVLMYGAGQPCNQCGMLPKKVGCYKDRISDRALSDMLLYEREQGSARMIDWNNFTGYFPGLASRCASKAEEKGYQYFGLQYHAECWSGNGAYDKHGLADPSNCISNYSQPCNDSDNVVCVGVENTNYVYKLVTNLDDCKSNPCENGGTCTNEVNNYTCTCAAGYTGTNCDTDILECSSSPCHNGGVCNEQVNGYSCTCADGYTGTNCDTDILECSSSPCHNGGVCNEQVNGYSCTCADGYTGPTCDDIETQIISVVNNHCASKPCQNGACSDLFTGYTCACDVGYMGTDCDININECASNPCKHGAKCTDQVNGYSCTCADGFTGSNCDTNIDECDSGLCENGGTCNDGINSYTCTCAAGYTGTNCEREIDECASGPCQNGGTCTDRIDGYNCTCAAGYIGSTCSGTFVYFANQTTDVQPGQKFATLILERKGDLQQNSTVWYGIINGSTAANKTAQSSLPANKKFVTFEHGQKQLQLKIEVPNKKQFFCVVIGSNDPETMTSSVCIKFLVIQKTFVFCASSDIAVPTGKNNLNVVLERVGILGQKSKIWYGVVNATVANKTGNYMPKNKTYVTFNHGQKKLQLKIQILNSNAKKSDETFFVVIGSSDPGIVTSSTCARLVLLKKENQGKKDAQHESKDYLPFFIVALILVMVALLVTCLLCLCLFRARRRQKKQSKVTDNNNKYITT